MAERQNRTELGDRARDVLKAVIREHIRSGRPVGSRRLAKIYWEKLSPATLRNVTADLEEMGYLEQPHTSAGRVPTAKGYRFYVDSLLETTELGGREVARIRRSLEQEMDPGELISKTCEVLSIFSDNVGFVMPPPISLAPLRHIEFIRLSHRRILVILVTGKGFVQHRVIEMDRDLRQVELDEAGHYLIAHFEGNPLNQIRDELLSLISEEKTLYDRMLRNVISLGAASLIKVDAEADEKAQVYVGGADRLLQKPELADIRRMVLLFRTFEEKSVLVKIINECLNENPAGPTVTIGLGKHVPEMRDWSLILSPYVYNQNSIGGLGILGPSRMEYEKAISLVDYVAKLFGQLMNGN